MRSEVSSEAPPQNGWLGLSCERLSLSSMSSLCVYIIEKGREGLENIKYMGNTREECFVFLPPPLPSVGSVQAKGEARGLGGHPRAQANAHKSEPKARKHSQHDRQVVTPSHTDTVVVVDYLR